MHPINELDTSIVRTVALSSSISLASCQLWALDGKNEAIGWMEKTASGTSYLPTLHG